MTQISPRFQLWDCGESIKSISSLIRKIIIKEKKIFNKNSKLIVILNNIFYLCFIKKFCKIFPAKTLKEKSLYFSISFARNYSNICV